MGKGATSCAPKNNLFVAVLLDRHVDEILFSLHFKYTDSFMNSLSSWEGAKLQNLKDDRGNLARRILKPPITSDFAGNPCSATSFMKYQKGSDGDGDREGRREGSNGKSYMHLYYYSTTTLNELAPI